MKLEAALRRILSGKKMGEALIELEHVLRTGEGNFTIQEANVFMKLRANCVRDFTLGLSGGSIVTWLASKKLPNAVRLYLAGAVGLCSGMWMFKKAADNSAQYILSLEGTRLQKELGAVMLKKYQNDPLIMQYVSKYFYSEVVYNDASDLPRLRWRYRNFFTDSYPETSKTPGTYDQNKDVGLEKINQNRKPAQMNTVVDATENPFDCIFGVPESPDEIPHSDTFNKPGSRAARGNNKRSHHRQHRKHHQGEGTDHA